MGWRFILKMANLDELTKILKLIPVLKLNEIMSYLSNKENTDVSLTEIENTLSINSSDIKNIKKLFQNFDNFDLRSLLIETFLEKKRLEEITTSKLVVTSNTHHSGVSSTSDLIFKMLHNAQNKITVVGYWVYDFPQFFEVLQKIQVENKRPITIEFYFDNAKKWKKVILKNWPIGYAPKIYGINNKQENKNKIKRLHAKMIIIDDKECLITSANLTKNAMGANIEAGIWTIDKKIITDSINVLKQLVSEGTLKKI